MKTINWHTNFGLQILSKISHDIFINQLQYCFFDFLNIVKNMIRLSFFEFEDILTCELQKLGTFVFQGFQIDRKASSEARSDAFDGCDLRVKRTENFEML